MALRVGNVTAFSTKEWRPVADSFGIKSGVYDRTDTLTQAAALPTSRSGNRA
jgi:hypothetical protein